jgi:adenosylmethionine-8-amino-7-oxononanoate aminotransferase
MSAEPKMLHLARFEITLHFLFELGLMVRQSGDAIAMSPPLVIEKAQIDEIIDITVKTIKAVA